MLLPLAASSGHAVPGLSLAAAAYLASLSLGLSAAALAGVRPIRRDGNGRPLDWEGNLLPAPDREERARAFLWLLLLVLAASVLQAAGSGAATAARDFREEAYGPRREWKSGVPTTRRCWAGSPSAPTRLASDHPQGKVHPAMAVDNGDLPAPAVAVGAAGGTPCCIPGPAVPLAFRACLSGDHGNTSCPGTYSSPVPISGT